MTENMELRRENANLQRQLDEALETLRLRDEVVPREGNPFAVHQDRRWESGFKVDIPEFNGSLKGDELTDWLSQVEEILEFKEVPDKRRVSLVTIRFQGRAQAWWQQLKTSRFRDGKNKITSWVKFRKHLLRAFLPFNKITGATCCDN